MFYGLINSAARGDFCVITPGLCRNLVPPSLAYRTYLCLHPVHAVFRLWRHTRLAATFLCSRPALVVNSWRVVAPFCVCRACPRALFGYAPGFRCLASFGSCAISDHSDCRAMLLVRVAGNPRALRSENPTPWIRQLDLRFARSSRWSEWRDLNPRPHGPEPCALPTALHPVICCRFAFRPRLQ